MNRGQANSPNYQLKRERKLRGWSQAELATRIGSDAKSVLRWEANTSSPTPYYRQKLCELFEKTAEELGLFEASDGGSKSSHLIEQQNPNKLSFNLSSTTKNDLLTFGKLLRQYRLHANLSQEKLASEANISKSYIGLLERDIRLPMPSLAEVLARILGLSEHEYDLFIASATTHIATKVDWGEAPFLEHFYGREKELTELQQWIMNDRCRLIVILGIGGIGKTALSTKLVEQIKDKFEYIFWRSLQNAPHLESVVRNCIQIFSRRQQLDLPESIDDQITLLIQYMRDYRCLIILDNVETILQEGSRAGHYREGYKEYERFLRRVGESNHKSCLLVTSREKPKEVAHVEGRISPVRSLQLPGLGLIEGQKILKDRELFGSNDTWADLIHLYSGNPLALKLVSESIRELFGGNIASFLEKRKAVFGDLSDLIDQQFARLSALEQEVMYWLAIEREPISLDELGENIVHPMLEEELFVAVGALRRRSMVETNSTVRFTLQPVIMEYMTDKFVEQVVEEINAEEVKLFESHALIQADAKEYLRESQVRLILVPLSQRLCSMIGKDEVEKKLKNILSILYEKRQQETGYAAGNILNLLVHLRYDLRGYNLSYLTMRQVDLRDANLQEVNFTGTHFFRSAFRETFGNILSMAWSVDGMLLAVGTANREVLMWHIPSRTLLRVYYGHRDWVRSLAFSPNGDMLASGSDDQTVRLWDVSTSQCLQTLRGHSRRVYSVAFSPDGSMLASGSEDQTVRLWDVSNNRYLRPLIEHVDRIRSVAFSPDGHTLASGSSDQTVRLWETSTGQCLQVFQGHSNWIRSVAFSPDGHTLASGSEDQTVRLWDISTGQCLQTLSGHSGWVYSVAFSPDGSMLASGSEDQTVRLWETSTGQCLQVLQGHGSWIRSIAFSPDGSMLASGSEDQTVRLWETSTGQCLETLHGYSGWIWSIAFSPDGSMLASGSDDQTIRLWNTNTGQCLQTFHGYSSRVWSIAFSPDGNMLASGSDDQIIRLWETSTGQCLQTLKGHSDRIRSVAFRPDGKVLASGSEDQTVRLWETSTGQCLQILKGHSDRVRPVAFRPDGKVLASGSEDQTVRLWETSTGQCLRVLRGHNDAVRSLAFRPDGKVLASGSDDQTVRLWDVNTDQCLQTLSGHRSRIWSVAFSSDGRVLASGSEDQTICLWDANSGQYLQTLCGYSGGIYSVAFGPNERILASGSNGIINLWNIETGKCFQTWSSKPYYLMNITNMKGLTEAQKASLKELGAIVKKVL